MVRKIKFLIRAMLAKKKKLANLQRVARVFLDAMNFKEACSLKSQSLDQPILAFPFLHTIPETHNVEEERLNLPHFKKGIQFIAR